MERLRIEYETGYMELDVEAFFPCVAQKARKIAALIKRYCSDETKAELLSELGSLLDGYAALCGMYEGKLSELPEDSQKRHCWNARLRKAERLRKRMENNIKIISGGRKDG